MAPRWTEEMNIYFVKLYREHECLWDQFNVLYKNKFARESALSDIASKMNIEGFGSSEVNKNIKALCATYHSEMTKRISSEKSGSGLDDIYTPTLKWFDEMKHIMTTGTMKRKTQSTLVSLKPAPQLRGLIESKEDDGTVSEIDEIQPLPQPQPSTSKVTATKDDPPEQVAKRFKPRSKMQQIAATARELRQLGASISNAPENEFVIFGKHVASQLKQMKLEDAITAIGEINNILTQKRLMSVLGQQVLSSASSTCVSDALESPIFIIAHDDVGQVATQEQTADDADINILVENNNNN